MVNTVAMIRLLLQDHASVQIANMLRVGID
jgi:hypothetical protein